MTQDEIIRMALEAGFNDYFTDELVAVLERFAALVAEATKEKAAKLVENASSYQSWQVAAAIRGME